MQALLAATCNNVQSAKSQKAEQPMGSSVGLGFRLCAEACTCQAARTWVQQHKSPLPALSRPSGYQDCAETHMAQSIHICIGLRHQSKPHSYERERCIIDQELL